MTDALNSVSIKNYKAFFEWSNLEIRPLTLVYGYNSAGKSAMVRFLKLLADSAKAGCLEPIDLQSDAIRGGGFNNLINKYSDGSSIEIELEFSKLKVKYSVREFSDLKKRIVEHLDVIDLGHGVEKSYEWMDWSSDGADTSEYLEEESGTPVTLRFEGLKPEFVGEEGPSECLVHVHRALEKYSKNFFWLSANRGLIERFELEGGVGGSVLPNGDGVTRLLHSVSDKVISDISGWYEEATGYRFVRTVEALGGKRVVRFTLHPRGKAEADIDIVDTGEGMGQVLPVIGLLTMAAAGSFGSNSTIALEHPELHIHPDAHKHLANKFCLTAVSENNCRVVVETHSENLLLAVQLAIAEDRISPSDVIIHWVKDNPAGATISPIKFDKQARPIGDQWPVGVFQDTTQLARALFKKRSEA